MGLFSKDRNELTPSRPLTSNTEDGNISFGSDDEYRDKQEAKHTLNSQRLKSKYGINDTIKLLRKISHIDDEVKIVVAKTTLESMNVVISDIITDAEIKDEKISSHIAKLKEEIKNLEEEIRTRSDQITALDKDLTETREVKECLQKGEPAVSVLEKEADEIPEEKNLTNDTNADDSKP